MVVQRGRTYEAAKSSVSLRMEEWVWIAKLILMQG